MIIQNHMHNPELFLVSSEDKDTYCLSPLQQSLESKQCIVQKLNIIDDLLYNNGSILKHFQRSVHPIAVISSVFTTSILEYIRPRDSFTTIGIEHGIAPFKKYTYSKELLSSDYYLAPTRGWAQRLAHLYPEERAKIRLGGYPKLDALKDTTSKNGEYQGVTRGNRILVILSWGVKEDAFNILPDFECIDYLLHPSDKRVANNVQLTNARLHISSPDVTKYLIRDASLVVGDFSSLTLECICLDKHVIYMIDRSIYSGDCDIGPNFFQADAAEYGRVPESNYRIPLAGSITASDLARLVDIYGTEIDKYKKATVKAEFSSEFLPPSFADNRQICAKEIFDLSKVHSTSSKIAEDYERSDIVDSMCFIYGAYRGALGRFPDPGGLQHYLRKLESQDDSALDRTMAVCRSLYGSPEARRMRSGAADRDDVDAMLTLIEQEARRDRDRTCQIIETVGAQLLPDFYRSKRDSADGHAGWIHYGVKFASSAGADIDDLVKLAHACAGEERLDEALQWIGKAIELHSEQGEYLRFKASILERMGRFEEALHAAHQAQALGAQPDAISADIDRINGQHVAHLETMAEQLLPAIYRQHRNVAVCGAERIRLGMKLASSPDVSVDDLVQLAHACAAEEMLADALHWIGKAIELNPDQGEHLRFKASILERMGRLADAQDVAIEAKDLGADPDCIGSDINRINSLHVLELWRNVASDDRAASLASYSQLLAMGKLSLRDVMKFARKLVKATV
jgi:tetratricopeptide (TPR) repeat protein